ncbi:MAG: hypothetical protein V1792_25675 [Pseudomonadota bacterium]
MGRHRFPILLLVAAVLLPFPAGTLSRADEPRCVQSRRAVEQKKYLVSEYMRALQTSYDRKETRMAELLNFKINELKAQIREMERNLTGCPDDRTGNPGEGMEGAKSDQGTYTDKNCQELRKILFSLVRRIHALDKRKKSLLSNLTEREERSLREAGEERETVEHILGTRCRQTEDPQGLRRRLRR